MCWSRVGCSLDRVCPHRFDETARRDVRPGAPHIPVARVVGVDAHPRPRTQEDVMLKNVMFATIYVSDQDRALTFYTEGLGLEKGADHPIPDGRFVTVAPSDKSVHIILWPGNPGHGIPAADTTAGPVFLESDDLRKEFEVLRSRG